MPVISSNKSQLPAPDASHKKQAILQLIISPYSGPLVIFIIKSHIRFHRNLLIVKEPFIFLAFHNNIPTQHLYPYLINASIRKARIFITFKFKIASFIKLALNTPIEQSNKKSLTLRPVTFLKQVQMSNNILKSILAIISGT